MKTRPCGNGFATAIPTWEDPEVVMCGPTKDDAEYLAAKEHLPLARLHEREQARLAQEFAAQAVAEFLKIRTRA